MKRFAARLFLFLAIGLASAAAQVRTLPADTERGFIRHVEGNVVSMNGKRMRLAPGASIRSPANLIIVATSLPAQGALAEYVLDRDGQIFKVWLLTQEEAARKRKKR